MDDSTGKTKPGLGEMATLRPSDEPEAVPVMAPTLRVEESVSRTQQAAALMATLPPSKSPITDPAVPPTGRMKPILGAPPTVNPSLVPPTNPVSVLEGQIIDDRYELIRLIGEGGMGAVYEGRHVTIGSRVAIKTLHADAVNRPEALERFRREAQAAGTIGHPNIVRVHDIGQTEDGLPYMVMDFVDGGSLARLLYSDAPLDTKVAIRIASQMLSALGAAHEKGIIHRDVKPENVVLTTNEEGEQVAKLLDFGISKFHELDSDQHGLTATGTILGTPLYMAPEQAAGSTDVDHLIDIYAVGTTLYVMLTGHQPFSAPNYNALMVKIITESPKPLTDFAPDLDPSLIAVVEKAMAQEREDRFSTAHEMIDALEGRTTVAAPRPTTSGSVEDGRSPRWPWAAGAAAAVIALLVAGVYGIDGRDTGDGTTTPASIARSAVDAQPAPAPAPVEDLDASAPTDDSRPEPVASPTIRLRLETVPPTAVIRLNGQEMPNPLDHVLPRSEELSALVEIRLPGYRTIDRTYALTEDINERINLRRSATKRTPPNNRRLNTKAEWEPPSE